MLSILKGRNDNKIVTSAPTTVEEYKDQLLKQYARLFLQSINQIFVEKGIAAQRPIWQRRPRYISIGLELVKATDLERAKRLTDAIGMRSGQGVGKATVPVDAIILGHRLVYNFNLPEFAFIRNRVIAPDGKIRLWSDVTVDHPALDGAVGLGMRDTPVYFEFTEEASQALVCGAPGSGKTELVKTMIYQLCQRYSPTELGIGIVDPKGHFNDFQNEAHQLWQIARRQDEINALVAHFHSEFLRRENGEASTNQRHLLVLDEADQSIVLGVPLNHERIHDIVLRGRSLKVNVIVVTHKPDVNSIGQLRPNLTNLWYGKVASSRDSGAIGAGLNLHQLAGRGDFIAIQAHHQIRFQAALTQPQHLNDLVFVEDVPSPVKEAVARPSKAVVIAEQNPAHRPVIEASPEYLAYYVYHGPDNVTEKHARDVLGIKRTEHVRNRDAAQEFVTKYKQLEGGRGIWTA